MTATETGNPTMPNVYEELLKIAGNSQTFQRLMLTDAKIAQTPKKLIWTLNKAKLFRYEPVAPEDKRRRIPLLMVFAIMNRPHVLDLRPGHSFTEYMLKFGYDLYLLDWGTPGPEDSALKFDDYALEYLPRVTRKIKSSPGRTSSACSAGAWER